MLNIIPAISVELVKNLKPMQTFLYAEEPFCLVDLENSDIGSSENKYAGFSLENSCVVAFTGEEEVTKIKIEGKSFIDY